MNKKSFLTLCTFFVLCGNLFAQQDEPVPTAQKDSIWSHQGSFSLNYANVGLSNWAGGGESSISLGSILDFDVKRKTNVSTWTNSMNLAYGIMQQGSNELRKTDDQIVLRTEYGYNISKSWNVNGFLNFQTQFTDGYKYKEDPNNANVEIKERISNFMAPGYVLVSTGLQHVTSTPKLSLTGTFSPTTGKLTFVLDDTLSALGLYGVKPGENFLAELGYNFNSKLTYKVMENVTFKNSLNLFGAYEKMHAVDVNWEMLLAMKINKFLTANIATNFIYDEDAEIERDNGTFGPAVQFKHVLNVGLNVIF